jgi:hypothetical protein
MDTIIQDEVDNPAHPKIIPCFKRNSLRLETEDKAVPRSAQNLQSECGIL